MCLELGGKNPTFVDHTADIPSVRLLALPRSAPTSQMVNVALEYRNVTLDFRNIMLAFTSFSKRDEADGK